MINQMQSLIEQLRQESVVYYPILFFTIGISLFFLFQLLCLNAAFKNWATKKLRLVFLKRKIYFGSYSANLLDMKKFASYNDVMCIYVADTNLKFTPILPEGIDNDTAKHILAEQKREYSRKQRKTHKSELWYVENNFITRWFGWTPSPIALQLLDVDKGRVLKLKGAFQKRLKEMAQKKVSEK